MEVIKKLVQKADVVIQNFRSQPPTANTLNPSNSNPYPYIPSPKSIRGSQTRPLTYSVSEILGPVVQKTLDLDMKNARRGILRWFTAVQVGLGRLDLMRISGYMI